MSKDDLTAEASRVHGEAIVIDGMTNSGMTSAYFECIRKGGITATMIPVSVSAPFRKTIDQLSALLKLVDENREKVSIIRKSEDILEAKREGKLGLIFVLEDSRQLEDDLDLLRVFWALGIRRMQLVSIMQNSMGSGKRERHDSGLTTLGIRAIERMEQSGMLIDLCHCADRTFRDAMEVVKKPVVLSHSNPKGAYDHGNNVSDEQLSMVAKNGGVIGISGLPYFVAAQNPTIDQVMDHIDYVAKRIGIDHVGIGLAIFENHPLSFYDQFKPREHIYGPAPWKWPKGIETIESFPNLTEKLLERGYSEANVRKVLGDNFLRVFKEVWG
ncbi:MAG: membrane dipeptidase [Chloroflexi bacterium]|nr:membrane dipeptidase [Chloroflexota bacterium]